MGLVAFAAVATGCLTLATPPTPVDFAAIEAAIGEPLDPGHDHADPDLHSEAFNLVRVSASTGRSGEIPAEEFYGASAVKRDIAYLSRYGPESGLVIFDVTHPEAPVTLGSVRINAGFEPDVEVTADGKWVFFSSQRKPVARETPAPDALANAQSGIHLVDVSDKANPRWVSFTPVPPDGPHSITYAEIGGRHILFQSVYSYAYVKYNLTVPEANRLVISELDLSQSPPALVTLATLREPIPRPPPEAYYMPHDLGVSEHPVTGQTIACVAWWDHGVILFDVTDPANPKRLSVFDDVGPAAEVNMHHAQIFPHTIDGKVVMVAEPEVSTGPDTGYVSFVDVTDPARPKRISQWRLPGELPAIAGLFSPHYFDVKDGRLAIANYHGGLWVVDVHDRENMLNPRAVAYAFNPTTRASFKGLADGFPLEGAFDAWWKGDYIFSSDAREGLLVYRYTGPSPAPM